MVDLSLLAQPLFTLGDTAVSFGMAGAALLVILAILWMWRSAVRRTERAELVQAAEESEQRLAEILKAQSEMQGRMATMAELFGARQAELNQSIQQRLDGMTQRLGTTLTEQTRSTHENLTKLQERLAVIDTAQNNIQSLAKDVVGLQAILTNKQTRGAFGQSRMETIIADALPMGSYTFQATLSNNQRPDCLIHMPNGQPSLAIDAKFPLEAWHAIRAAENAEAAKPAAQQFRRDMDVHIRAISEKYLIKGETQDTAFLFVPSESIFAEIHENFEEIVQRAHRARVVIVSPSLLMLSIQVVQAILRDQRMREQAHLIQGEVAKLMMDLTRLDQRVRNLQTHFGQTQKDIDQIVTSTDKLAKRGARIEALELEAPGADTAQPAAEPTQAVESRTGSLRLRVVEED
ncbi:DNA recombination protein RmuC [Georhizobium profundi]|jgi:DNA recombination protein RmuC|uniref:DNA recombination protein RmuC homolog n=2 Tax=Georhizobium profundi TaxID=2341112 RepID=A0A3S9AZ06_9HYPH|nr:DNA recombination protein RmuC [Georhizobium profundi]AZN69926.1 DNA recombination protein RmuC [Georhizobium profundi]